MSARLRLRRSDEEAPASEPQFPVVAAAAAAGSSEDPALDLIGAAEALEIPWERLLREEIAAEQVLRRHARGMDSEMPLATALTVLPSSFLKSWRVRDLIQNLSCEARGASFQSAIAQLRAVFRRLIGRTESGRALYAGRLWLAYQRVLLLQRTCFAARRSSGTLAERIAVICTQTRCAFDDAAWAIAIEEAPTARNRLDEAVDKVRQEGFPVPREATEAKSFAKLRRLARGAPAARPGRGKRPGRGGVALLQRVETSSDGV